MMKLFIQIRDGQPYQHPIFEDNFQQAFPDIDVNNLPPEFAKFERVPCPRNAGLFEIDEVRYEWDGNIVKDVWFIREMTEEEKDKTINEGIERIYATYDWLKTIAQNNIDSTIGEIQDAWKVYMKDLQSWTLPQPINIERPNFPKAPVILEDGTIYTINSSGTLPNVIG